MVFVGPLRDRTVRFEATVNDHRSTVKTFPDDVGFGERFVGIPVGLCRSSLIGGMTAAGRRVIWSLPDGGEDCLGSALALHVVHKVILNFETDAVLLKILRDLSVRHLVADGIVNVVLAHGPGGLAGAGRRL